MRPQPQRIVFLALGRNPHVQEVAREHVAFQQEVVVLFQTIQRFPKAPRHIRNLAAHPDQSCSESRPAPPSTAPQTPDTDWRPDRAADIPAFGFGIVAVGRDADRGYAPRRKITLRPISKFSRALR